MWTCPICKTANDTYKCSKCDFDKSKDYMRSRTLSELSEKDRKLPQKQNLQKNVMMKDRGYDYVFGRKEKRKRIRRITFLSGENTLGLDTWDISEAQDGSVLAHLKGNFGREKELFIWADGKITANKNCSRLFFGYENLEAIEGLENLETGLVEDMSGMFENCGSLRTLDLSHFDTRQVRDMSRMFEDCQGLEKLDVSHLDTSQVKDMKYMFAGCESLEKLDLSHLNTSQVKDMKYMFSYCESLEKLDLNHMDTSRVESMLSMFNDCEELKELDLSHFDTSQVRDMKYMFADCSNLERLDISNFEVKQIWTWDMEGMFSECDNLEELDISSFDERKNDSAFLRGLSIPYDTEVTC